MEKGEHKLKPEQSQRPIRSRSITFEDLPESVVLKILSYLPVKYRCVSARVCKQWRRISADNSLWRHVNLLEYRLDLTKMWKILRAHFSPCLLTMKIKGFFHTFGRKRKRASMSDAMLKELSNRCPNLWLLHLYDCNTDELSANMLPTSVTHLCITHSTWQPRWFKGHQDHLQGLKSLDLNNSTRVDNHDLQDIAQISGLQELVLRRCYRIRGPIIGSILATLPNLTMLDIGQTDVDHEGLHHISRHGKVLKVLRIAYTPAVCDSTLLTLSLGLESLTELDVSGCANLTPEGLKALWSLKKLEKVNVEGIPGLSGMRVNGLRKKFSQKVDIVTWTGLLPM